jgi:predicted transcriptional regulator
MAVSVKIDNELEDRLEKLARSRHQSADGLISTAIEQFVEREEARESFAQEAQASFQSYQETGLHLTGDELRAWLRTWGTEAETDPPECHR